MVWLGRLTRTPKARPAPLDASSEKTDALIGASIALLLIWLDISVGSFNPYAALRERGDGQEENRRAWQSRHRGEFVV